jgi:hypothetical protein
MLKYHAFLFQRYECWKNQSTFYCPTAGLETVEMLSKVIIIVVGCGRNSSILLYGPVRNVFFMNRAKKTGLIFRTPESPSVREVSSWLQVSIINIITFLV